MIKISVRDTPLNRDSRFWSGHIGKEGTALAIGPDGRLEQVEFPGMILPVDGADTDRFSFISEDPPPPKTPDLVGSPPDGALFAHLRCTKALNDVVAERERQEKKWGTQDHDPYLYLAILGEEFGETCQAALEMRFSKHGDKNDWAAELRKDAVQTAAVALALVECLDRNQWQWGSHGDPTYREGSKT